MMVNVPMGAPPSRIEATAKAKSEGLLNSADLVVRKRGGEFFDSRTMSGTNGERIGSIDVPSAGTYAVMIEVNAQAGTTWEGSVAVDGTQKEDSGKRTANGVDEWFVDVDVL
jgi:hypothetical protein